VGRSRKTYNCREILGRSKWNSYDEFKKFKDIYLLYDRDLPGVRAANKIRKEFKHHDSVLVVSNSVYCNEIFTKLEIKENIKETNSDIKNDIKDIKNLLMKRNN
jgi:5S rRNA maturation endonuclease (ribonuclease M5)